MIGGESYVGRVIHAFDKPISDLVDGEGMECGSDNGSGMDLPVFLHSGQISANNTPA